MRSNAIQSLLIRAGLAASVLLASGAALAAPQQINLSAGPNSIALPDGTTVPMWGYSCGPVVAGSSAACAKLNPAATGWSPVVITLPAGQDLAVTLTNNLTFGPNNVPTSLVIVGQLGGGLGAPGNFTDSPTHAVQGTSWPIAGGTSDPTTVNKPPPQGKRVQSFSTEVVVGTPQTLTWTAPRPGTYLIESGTHPSIQGPMGLFGILVVTTAPASGAQGTAYPGVPYDADVSLLLSEIDPVQNNAVSAAVNTTGFSETRVWSGQPGGCGNPTSGPGVYQTCYPPAVNYSPLYYLVNGVAFDKTSAPASLFPTAPATGLAAGAKVLVRLVNAGLRMHVPSMVGPLTGAAPGTPGVSLIAEDGNPLPGLPRVQSEVFMAAGKTYDVLINAPATPSALPIFDRQLSLSGNAVNRDAGMLAYISVNGGPVPSSPALAAAACASPNVTYNSLVSGQTLTVSDPSKGIIAAAKCTNVYGVTLTGTVPAGLVLNPNGTFSYTGGPASFAACANGNCSVQINVSLGNAALEAASGITVHDDAYASSVATTLTIKPPGILANDSDGMGYPLTVAGATAPVSRALSPSGTVVIDQNGGFTANVPGAGTYTFTYSAKNSQGVVGSGSATVTLTFPAANGPAVTVLDGSDKTTQIADYRWVIEEDRTFYVDPNCTTNPLPAGCPTVTPQGAPAVFGTSFHTSHMPLVAAGCTGPLSCESGQTQGGSQVVCDQGNGICHSGTQQAALDPSQVHLDPTKRYYISILPGDAADPFNAGYAGAPDCSVAGNCGHGMGGAPIAAGQTAVTVLTQPSPYPTAKLTVFVFEDDFPLNGEHDAGGGVDVLSPNEPGLGGFEVTIFDDAGGTGDATGQPTYDMFNMPLTNSLAGTIDPVTNLDACPISPVVTSNVTAGDASQKGIIGMIVTCPTFESDGVTLSPLAGQAIVNNLYQGRYGVVATPGADRIAAGEEWLQTNTLDGQKAHDSFMRIGEPAYFQEFGPAGYHVSIGFANPKIINDRGAALCTTKACTNSVTGHVTTARMSRTPDERLYGSGTRDGFSFTQCYASLGDPDGADFAFTKCDGDGNFAFSKIPTGNYKLTIFDQWNDQIVDGISTPVGVNGNVAMGEIAAHQWQANIYTRTFMDTNGNGVSDKDSQGNALEPGLPLVATNIRFRDGSFSNFNNTDLNGFAGFNEVFPLFSWYVIETDTTRYKTTGVHVVYDAGGPVDGSSPGGTACSSSSSPSPCGSSVTAANLANTYDANPLPPALSVPGAVYCTDADCTGQSIANGAIPSSLTNHSTGRIDPPTWFGSYGWQGFAGQNSFLEFGKKPYVPGENGGIHGHVVYASTRPFDDPQLLLQLSWEPLVPNVTVNLYREGFAADGVTPTLTLVDSTKTTSFDDWAQGVRPDGVPNMNCPGQSTTDPFFYSLQDQPQYLQWYDSLHGGPAPTALPNHSQYKCYDGMHNWNQLQPAPYDGIYRFPSVTSINLATGKPATTNCATCVANPDDGLPMLPAGKYVVEVVVPPGYELVKEEDKNILIGDNYIAPATQQFAGLGNIFIMPDQAEVAAAYNASNALNPTNTLGRNNALSSHEGDTGSVESFWPCVGAARIVPDFISLFPQSAEVAPFAGATRNLCDRKEVTLSDQMSALAKFYIFTSTHVAAHYTGVITDDFTGEFDPFSPQFGEKFAPAYLPVSVKDWTGNEISRVYSDQFGAYNGLSYSTWEVNPPNPTGYGPTMMVVCMNDAGTGATPDPLFQSGYSQFCYELPFMPGQTGYFDTPVVPTSAFSEGYNHPDCDYPDTTPAISEVDVDGSIGPWGPAPTTPHTLQIYALGTVPVNNYAYTGPEATAPPFNQKTTTRKYSFGSAAGSVALVSPDGNTKLNLTATWGDLAITASVPVLGAAFNCPLQQQAVYGGSAAKCGQLVITAANGKQSVDTVTVTIGGKTPTHVAASQSIQKAIDSAQPGDMLIVDPTTRASATTPAVPTVHHEMLLMWKPVRLQGVGAASAIVDANAHPAGMMDPWRKQVACLFGLTPDGRPRLNNDNTCANGWSAASGGPQFPTMIVDRLPFESLLGWDTTLNGNLAEQLIEPSLLGAYEGATITVLGKGVKFPIGTQLLDAFGNGVGSAYPANTQLLNSTTDCLTRGRNPYPGNFYCNPSSIDGLGVRNSSQGGGGIFVHAYAHNLQIGNNRVYGNTGTQNGGIAVGQGEHADVALGGFGVTPTSFPGSCESSFIPNLGLPFCYDMHVNVHHNSVTRNASMGDELFSSTGAGAGGVSLYTGADYYNLTNNWVCGNLGTGDGGGVAHIGFIKNGTIAKNRVLFNQSTNPTISTNGGGVLVMGAPDLDPPCSTADQDCVPDPGSVPPSDGTGPGLVIDSNLILGNSAESGSGGGLRLQHVSGTDVVNFPNGRIACTSFRSIDPNTPQLCAWNSVSVTNNIIANNVAGWDGAGVSLQDALAVNIVNNTIVSNDSTASSGTLFSSLFAPTSSSPGTNCTINSGSGSCPQVAGLVSTLNSPIFIGAIAPPPAGNPLPGFSCPVLHGSPSLAVSGTDCRYYSIPAIDNDVIWQNRSFEIGVTSPTGSGLAGQQATVALLDSFTGSPAPIQPSVDATAPNGGGAIITGGTGACAISDPNVRYWDIGVRGDAGPSQHQAVGSTTARLSPTQSVLTDAADYPGLGNTGSNPTVVSQYCNGSRVPPEACPPGTTLAACLSAIGYQVPPGTNETNALPTPVFSLLPSATVDEGNNWINMRWGPLSLTNPVVTGADGLPATLGNYGLASGSPAINYVPFTPPQLLPTTPYNLAPPTDFNGTARKTNGLVDAGAVEFASNTPPPTVTSITPTSGARGATVAVTINGTNLTGSSAVTMTPGGGVTCTGVTATATAVNASCAITRTAGLNARDVTVTTPSGPVILPGAFQVTGATLTISAPSPLLNTGGTATKNGTITVTNTATGAGAGPFTFTAAPTVVKTSGPFVGTFSVTGGTCTNGAQLAPGGGSCTITVRYVTGGSTATSTAHVTVAGTGITVSPQNGPNFNAN